MAYNGLIVDNVAYKNIHIASCKRDGEVLDGKNSGRVTAGDMFRDVIGTFYNYTMQIDTDEASLEEYDALFEVLTAPVKYHTVDMPYAQGYIRFQAYVSSVSDELKSVRSDGNKWNGMTMKFVAMKPYRRA